MTDITSYIGQLVVHSHKVCPSRLYAHGGRSSREQGIRIVYVAPCWIKSPAHTADYEQWLVEHGVEFGEVDDCANCMMRIACDKSINGKFEW